MKKKLQKIVGIMLILFASCFGGLAGCKNKYADMKVELDQTSINLFLGELDEDGKEMNNTATFTASVSGAPSGASLDVFAYQSTPSVITITKDGVADENGDTTFTIVANQAFKEPVIVSVRTKEGEKVASLEVLVTKKITNLAVNPQYAPYVVVGEEGTILDVTRGLIFTPEDTSQDKVTFSIDNANGHEAEITENGKLVVTRKNGTQPVMVKVTSEASGIEPVTIPVKVIEPIQDEDIKLMVGETQIIDSYIWAVSDFGERMSELELDILVSAQEDIVISSESERILSPNAQAVFTAMFDTNQVLSNENKIKLYTNGNVGANTLKLVFQVKGYDYKIEKNIVFTVKKLPTQVFIKMDNNELEITNTTKRIDIYDKYNNNLGKKISVRIGDDLAFDKSYKIELSSQYTNEQKTELTNAVQFSYLGGNTVELGSVISPTTESIFIKALTANKVVKYDIIAVGSNENNKIFGTLELNLSRGISQSGIMLGTPNEPFENNTLKVELNENLDTQIINFYIDAEEYSSEFYVSVDSEQLMHIVNPNVRYVDAELENDFRIFSIEIQPLGEGQTTLHIASDNNIKLQMPIIVYSKIDDIAITTDSPIKNHNIADNGEDLYRNNAKGQKTLNKLVVALGTNDLKLNLIKFYEKANKITNTSEYKQTNAKVHAQSMRILEGEKFISLVMHNSEPYALLDAKNAGKARVECSVETYTENDEYTTFDIEFEVIVYIPVEKVVLSNIYVELIDTQRMYYYQADMEKEITATVYPHNATLTYKDRNETTKDFSKISWYKNNNFIDIEENGNVLNITGKTLAGETDSKRTLITASLTQFSKIFNVFCEVVVKNPIKTSELGTTYLYKQNNGINVGTPEIAENIYIDSRKGLTQQYSLFTDIYPSNAKFKDIIYFNLPTFEDYQSNLYVASQTLRMQENGEFSINRAGRSYVLVVAKDSVNKNSIENTEIYNYLIENYKYFDNNLYVQATDVTNENFVSNKYYVLDDFGCYNKALNFVDGTQYYIRQQQDYEQSQVTYLGKITKFLSDIQGLIFKVIPVKIADGLGESTSLNIGTVQDLLSINTLEGLDKFYILTSVIDCSNIQNFEPIGSFENRGFSGHFNGNSGKYYIKNIRYIMDIKGYADSLTYGLFSTNKGTIKNLNISINKIDAEISFNENGQTLCFGGLAGNNEGILQDCSVEIISGNLATNVANFYFGGMVAQNKNEINNPTIKGNIEITRKYNGKTSIGGLVGENFNGAKIIGTFDVLNVLSGAENAVNNDNLSSTFDISLNLQINYFEEIKENGAVGGIVGYNSGKISNIRTNAIIQDISMGLNNTPTKRVHNIGGVAGISRPNTNEVIDVNNIDNYVLIENVLSSAKIVGNSNIGGIVGKLSNSKIEKVLYLIFEQYDEDATGIKAENFYMLVGIDSVGGISGTSENSSINYAMVRSYVNRSFESGKFEGDIKLISNIENVGSNGNIGGLVGTYNGLTINNSFAYLTINANGSNNCYGLVGNEQILQTATEFDATTTYYEKSYIYIEATNVTSENFANYYINNGDNYESAILFDEGETYYQKYIEYVKTTNVTSENFANYYTGLLNDVYFRGSVVNNTNNIEEFCIKTNSSNWGIDEKYNDNLPYLLINGKPFIIQEPKSLSVELNASDSNNEKLAQDVTDDIEAENYSILMFLDNNNNGTNEDYINKYEISKLLNITVSPEGASNAVRYEIDGSSISIEKINNVEYIVLKKAGKSTLKIVSTLNNKAQDSIDIYVFDFVNEISITTDVEHKNKIETNFELIKGKSTEVYFASDSKSVVDYKISANAVQDNIKINDKEISMIDEINGNPEKIIKISSAQSLVFFGNSVTESEIAFTFKPFVKIGNKDIVISSSITSACNLNVEVVYGINDINLSFSMLEITQKDNSKLDVIVDCEAQTNLSLNDGKIEITEVSQTGSLTKEVFVVKDTVNNMYTINSSVVNNGDKTISNDKKCADTFEATFTIKNSIAQGTEKENNFEVIIKVVQAPSVCAYQIPLKFIAQVGTDGKTMSKDFVLNIVPQDVNFLALDFYSNAEVDASGNYNINEVPTTSLLAGKVGLLKIDLYPDYSSIERVEVIYGAFSYPVDMQQMVKKENVESGETNKSRYTIYNMSTPKIPNGIVFDNTYKNIKSSVKTEDVNTKYGFDGFLYVYILIPSVIRDSTLDLTVTAYSKTGNRVSKNLTLSIELPSSLLVEFNSQRQAIIAQNHLYEKALTVTATKLFETENDAMKLIGGIVNENYKNLIEIGTESEYDLVKINESTYRVTYDIKLKTLIGEEQEIIFKYDKLVNNQIQTYDSNILKLYVVSYTVDGYDIDGSKNNVFEKVTGASYPLKVVLQTTPSREHFTNHPEIKLGEESVIDHIVDLEDEISLKLNTWYAYTGVVETIGEQEITIYGYYPINFTRSYDFFSFAETEYEEGKRVIKITPSKESVTEVLQSVVAIKYNEGNALCNNGESSLLSHSNNEFDYINKEIYYKQTTSLRFIYNNTAERPIPISTIEQFMNISNYKHYRLINDIFINEPFVPFDLGAYVTNEDEKNNQFSLDGNGFTITLKQGFDISSQKDSDTINIGLFTEIRPAMTIKNLKVNVNGDGIGYDFTKLPKNQSTQEDLEQPTDLENQDETGEEITDDIINAKTINFGLIAGINDGNIYNCEVSSAYKENQEDTTQNTTLKITTNFLTDKNEQVDTNIGGIVAINNNSVTHSRSNLLINANRGYVAGLVAQNKGAISSCFYKVNENVSGNSVQAIKNEAITEVGNLVAGLVALNDNDATIKMSYVEGKAENINSIRYEIASIISSSNSAGFVNNNLGMIENCYSNIKVESEKRSAGFVFSNSGTISKCYSASKVESNNSNHTAFIGTLSNGKINSTNKDIYDCYYYKENNEILMTANGELAQDFSEQNASDIKTKLIGFDFTEKQEGVWTFKKQVFTPTEKVDPDYSIGTNGFGYTNIKVTETNTKLPTLVDANIIACPHIAIAEIKAEEGKEEEYYWNSDYEGSMFNPIVISSAEEYNKLLADKINEASTTNINNYNRYIRIISNIEFSTEIKPISTNQDFSGYLCGNGFTISGINISASNNNSSLYSTPVKAGNEDYGLFATIYKGIEDTTTNNFKSDSQKIITGQSGIVKNLALAIEHLTANQVRNVGGLAGSITDGSISNISIQGKDVVIQGKNLVGGLAGKITGQSIIKNIDSDISINAGNVQLGSPYSIYGYEGFVLSTATEPEEGKQYYEKLDPYKQTNEVTSENFSNYYISNDGNHEKATTFDSNETYYKTAYVEATGVTSENVTDYFIKNGKNYVSATNYDPNTTYYEIGYVEAENVTNKNFSNYYIKTGETFEKATTFVEETTYYIKEVDAYREITVDDYEPNKYYVKQEVINFAYAGSIAGVVDVDEEGSILTNFVVHSGVYILSNHGGFAFGLIGINSTVEQTKVSVDGSQYIRATVTAGGLVAENRGTLIRSMIEYEKGVSNNNLFVGTPYVIGGLVGLNYGGTITGCYNRINVQNTSSAIAGGLIGTTVGGDISYCYSTGKVGANHVAGGLIGSSLREDSLIKKSITSTADGESHIYSISSYILKNDEQEDTPAPKLKENLVMFAPNEKCAVVYGFVIGAVDSNSISEEKDNSNTIISNNNRYIYLSQNPDNISPCGGFSSVPNGVNNIPVVAIGNNVFTNKIGNYGFTTSTIKNANSYYKSIFKNNDWGTYYDIQSISSSNPYPQIIRK